MTGNEYASSALCLPVKDEPAEYNVGEDDVIEILVVDYGVRLVVTKEANGVIVRIAHNGPFREVAWKVL